LSPNAALVRDFIAAWGRADLDAIMAYFAEDCVYHNMPLDPVRGPEAIRGVIQGFAGMASEIDWITHHLAESDAGVVLTERTDRFHIAGRWIELPVMGAFEIRDGKISAWRDYFDLAQFQRQLPKAP
jgi:limonene-1,2-epoxide hydrolase